VTKQPIPRLSSTRVELTMPPAGQADLVARFFDENREFHEPWSPPRPDGFYDADFWSRRLEANRKEFRSGIAVRLFLLLPDHTEVVGTCNFTSINRGAFLACNLGYSLARRHTGKGLMTEALRTAVPWAFRELGLHRIQANYVPSNEASGWVLRQLGFSPEGFARDYLFIGGAWRDHVLTALTNRDPVYPVGFQP
jgi:[ribosomal protein S5]-alanine N-acetyltransferase